MVATPAFAKRPLKTKPEFEAYRGQAPSPRFPNPCRSALALVSPHPSSTPLAIFKVAVTPAAVILSSTPSAELFVVTCG